MGKAIDQFICGNSYRTSQGCGDVPRWLGSSTCRAGPSNAKKSANTYNFLVVTMIPIANVPAFTVASGCNSYGPEVFGWIYKKVFARSYAKCSAVARKINQKNIALAKIGKEEA